MLNNIPGPHQGQTVLTAGLPPADARAAMILIHGRGASAGDILSLVPEIDEPGFAYLAPQAEDYTWYPYPFMVPIEDNEPKLSSALAVIGALLGELETAGLPPEKVLLLGFSQGACLGLEYAVRHPRRFGGLVGLSGGLIGPPGTTWDYGGPSEDPLAGTPVFLGSSDVDPHIPKERILESVQVLEAHGAQVNYRLYPNMGHQVNQDELNFVRGMMQELV